LNREDKIDGLLLLETTECNFSAEDLEWLTQNQPKKRPTAS
jgi:hypothetical protein